MHENVTAKLDRIDEMVKAIREAIENQVNMDGLDVGDWRGYLEETSLNDFYWAAEEIEAMCFLLAAKHQMDIRYEDDDYKPITRL